MFTNLAQHDENAAAVDGPAAGGIASSAGARPQPAMPEDRSELIGWAALAAARAGDLPRTARLFEKYFWTAEKPKFAVLNDLLSLYHQTQQHERKARAVRRLIPPAAASVGEKVPNRQIMVLTLPKSAGTSVVQTLSATIGVPFVASGSDDARTPGYSAAVLEPALLAPLAGRAVLHQTHAMPWRENLQSLRRFCAPKLIVHLRDPRDALLSYYHMAESYPLHRLRLLLLRPDYDRLVPAARMALLAREVYPRFLEWMIGWVAVADALGRTATVTSFETFRGNPDGFFRHLTTFLTGKEQPAAKVRKVHFRNGAVGEIDESLMPSSMRAELHAMIPRELVRRFAWQP